MSSDMELGSPPFTSTQLSPKKVNPVEKLAFASKMKGMNVHALLRSKALPFANGNGVGKQTARLQLLPSIKSKPMDDELDSSYFSSNEAKRINTKNDSSSSDESSSADDDNHASNAAASRTSRSSLSVSESTKLDIKTEPVSPPSSGQQNGIKQEVESSSSSDAASDSETSSSSDDEEKTDPKPNNTQKQDTSSEDSESSSESSSNEDSSDSEDTSNKTDQLKSTQGDNNGKQETSSEDSESSSESSSDEDSSDNDSSSNKQVKERPKRSENDTSSEDAESSSEGSSDEESVKREAMRPLPKNNRTKADDSESSSGSSSSSGESDSDLDEAPQQKKGRSDECINRELNTTKYVETKRTQQMQSGYVDMYNLEAVSLKEAFNIGEISADDELFLVNIENNINPRDLLQTKLTFKSKQEVTLSERSECAFKNLVADFDREDKDNLCVLGNAFGEFGIMHLHTQGSVTINRNRAINSRKPVSTAYKSKEHVAFPFDKLRTRHPLFGISFEEQIALDPEVVRKLDRSCEVKVSGSKKLKKNKVSDDSVDSAQKVKKKKKKEKRRKDDDAVKDSEMPMPIKEENIDELFSSTMNTARGKTAFGTDESVITSKKKKKKKDKGKNKKHVSPVETLELEVMSLETMKVKEKKRKRKRDDVSEAEEVQEKKKKKKKSKKRRTME